ncbi:GNAT family N-acetyltransferase [Paenibacillus piri]|uniref:GNAT family N-acetyltransferase n=1 Tax=Paenibacillus piri TaxID=2547395 RepID=A0A4R5KCQ7_9BACL|nr:GNAT family N-acetyltransferase [Paenibacillus piri]TDF91860.1 GNAT family N-acetyltransferase [Paenibacillus piri]
MNKVDIRRIPKEQFADSLALSEFAFQYELPPDKREEKLAQFKEEENWGAYVDGKLAARLTVLDLHTWLYGKRLALGGVASVATWPEYRRGGLVARLLHNALQVMREQGQTVSYLHPFQFAFYRRFGWETYTDTKKYEIPTALLPKLPSQPGHVKRVGSDIGLLHSIYSAYASRYNGTLDRDEDWWKWKIFANKKGAAAVYFDAVGKPSGYVHYRVNERVCQIHELVSLDWETTKGLWKFIADHDSMIDKVTVSVPTDDKLPFVLDNPRIKQEIVPYFMARIVDVKRFLEQFPFAAANAGSGCTLKLSITDAHASWNNGLFTVEVDGRGHTAVHFEELPNDAPAAAANPDGQVHSLACDISTLTAIFMGYQRPAFMREIERLYGDEAAASCLGALIPQRQTYLPDFF